MSIKPLVSIVTPSFNSSEFIGDTIRSIQAQTYEQWELIVIDDCSTDNTVAIVKEFMKQDERIQITALENNSGAAVARNKAIELAKGTYIAFLDADDLWKPQKLERQLQFMAEKKVAVSFSSYEQIDESGKALGVEVHALRKLDQNKQLLSNYIGNLTGMYNAKELGKVYSPLIRKRQDWGLWLNCIEKAGAAYGIDESLAWYRVRVNSISSNKWKLIKYNYLFYKKAQGFNMLKSFRYLLRFLFEHFFVKSKRIKKTK